MTVFFDTEPPQPSDPLAEHLFKLRALLTTLNPNDKTDLSAVASALKSGHAAYVEPQQKLFVEWSQPYGHIKAKRIWDKAKPDPDALQLMFNERDRDRARSNGGALPFALEIGPASEREMTLEYIIPHWLLRKSPILFSGMGSSGKSSLVAAMCAAADQRGFGTLWVSSEEQTAWVRIRHVKAGGSAGAIATVPSMPTQRDPETGQVTSTTFGVYAHLSDAIHAAKAQLSKPLGVVVLDAVSALVDWKKGESPNDDASVKRAVGYLMGLAETHDVCIVMIHHFNKTQAASYDPNRVTGAPAWVNSPRLVFAVVKDDASETGFDSFVQVIKTNLGTRFAASFTTFPVHTLATYSDGAPDTVLCSARMNGGIVWGDRDVKLLVSNGEDPDAEKKATRKKSFDNKVMHIAEAVRGGATNRVTIGIFLASIDVPAVTQNQWLKIDEALRDKYGIDVITTAHGKYEYSMRANNVAPQGPAQLFKPNTL